MAGALGFHQAVEQKNALRQIEKPGALLDAFAVLDARLDQPRLELPGKGQKLEDLVVVFGQPELARRSAHRVFQLELSHRGTHMGRNRIVRRKEWRLPALEVAQNLLRELFEGGAPDAAGELFIQADLDEPRLEHARRLPRKRQRNDALGPHATGYRFGDPQRQQRMHLL